ncbi:hypothetical protein [Nitrosomonas communis]|uniref:hypothetical protein n=1 Tax=Nitrosomonas communis TaxID=44574 RepID=UPI003D286E43
MNAIAIKHSHLIFVSQHSQIAGCEKRTSDSQMLGCRDMALIEIFLFAHIDKQIAFVK